MDRQAAKRGTERKSVRRFIDAIFEVDGGIRFAAVYQGQYLLAGGMRKGVDPYDPDDSYDVDMQLARIGEITRAWQKWFGHLDSISLRYEKVSLLFHLLGEGRYLVMSAEPEVDLVVALSEIRRRPDFRVLAEAIP